MALSLRSLLALTAALFISLQPGFGVPLSSASELRIDSAPHRARTKRCSCNNQVDSECHYFCHLDIMWVNTPSKMTIYGLGSPLSRRRRLAGRCTCSEPNDLTCSSFCQNSFQNPAPMLVNPSPPSRRSSDGTRPDLLASLRNAVQAYLLVVELGVSSRRKPSRVHRRGNR